MVRAILNHGQSTSPNLWPRIGGLTHDLQSSSFVGPLIVGLISDLTGNIRYSFFFLYTMIMMSVPIMLTVDVNAGRKDARAYKYGGSDRS